MSTLYQGIRLLLAVIVITYSSCSETKPTDPSRFPVTIERWINWNGVFNPDYDTTKREAIFRQIRAEMAAVRSSKPPSKKDSIEHPLTYYLYQQLMTSGVKGPFEIGNVVINLCNCKENLLWNVDADLLLGVESDSSSVITSKPPNPGTVVRGGSLQGIDMNIDIKDPSAYSVVISKDSKLDYPAGYKSSGNAVIAVIDTGIDTLLIDQNVRKDLFWNGPSGSKNFLINANVDDYRDDHPVRHGTVVAGIAMNAFYHLSDNQELPKLMVLKAQNEKGEGRLFEFLCALSYAISNHATVVNTSFGYYGQDNSVMDIYAAKSKMDSIPIIAAAGNDTNKRKEHFCEARINPLGLLKAPEKLFYPACLGGDVVRYPVISVTGFRQPGIPCFYQHYSPEFITLGVYNKAVDTNCCSYALPFFNMGLSIEGSSFAAPVVSGELAMKISQAGRRANVQAFLGLLNIENATSLPIVTQANQYLTY